MSETQIKGGGAGARLRQGKRDHASAEQISKSEHMNVCPDCGGPLRFGSRDPCEGDYYWCQNCGAGPVLFPVRAFPRKPVLGIIDTETANTALKLKAAIKKYPVNTESACDQCPDCCDCPISGEVSAVERCGVFRKVQRYCKLTGGL